MKTNKTLEIIHFRTRTENTGHITAIQCRQRNTLIVGSLDMLFK